MNREEAKAYLAKIVSESGITDANEVAILTKAFENEKFSQGFIPTPEFSRGLDKERATAAEIRKRNEYLEQEWYPKAKATYETMQAEYQKGTKLLERYSQMYGTIDANDSNAVRQAAAATGMSKEEVISALEQSLAARDAATLDLFDVRDDYYEKFKKRLPINEFQEYVVTERQKGRADSLKALYKDWIEPEAEKVRSSELEARDKRIREEAIRDFAARNHVPVDPRPKEVSFLKEVLESQSKKDGEGATGREAFLEIMADPDPDTVKQRYK